MTTSNTQTVDKYDFRDFLGSVVRDDCKKTITLAGLRVNIYHAAGALGEFIRPEVPIPRVLQSNYETPVIKSFMVVNDDFQTAYTAAIDWADRAAHVSQIADAAATALNMEPSLKGDIDDMDIAETLARQCVEISREFPKSEDVEGEIDDHTVLEGRYTVDFSDGVEGYCVEEALSGGGVYTVQHEHDNGQPYEVAVRVSLVMVLSPTMTDGRWLAVYDVEEA